MQRKYPDHPIVGVGGVVFRADQVLLIKRGREPGLGQWSIPGGAVNLGETLKEAVIREVFEETHVKVEVLASVKVLDRILRDQENRIIYHYVLVDFVCEYKEGELKGDSDAQDACFVSLPDLPSYGVAQSTIEVILRANHVRNNPKTLESTIDIRKFYG
jgi:8-oxo-dGTP diphosphatase